MDYSEANEKITNKLIHKANYKKLRTTRHIPIAELLSKYANKNKLVLDIGAREGNLLLLLREYGFKNLYGVDVCADAIGVLRSKGLKGEVVDAQNFKLNKTFGVVIMSHVLEHCPNPSEVLDRVYRHMDDEGLLYIEVPTQTKDKSNKAYKDPSLDGHYHRFESVQEFVSFFDQEKWDCIYFNAVGGKNKGLIKSLFVKGGVKFPKNYF